MLRRAGVRAWERLFHNLRASRETELTSEHPLHVVCSWIGNSAIIAAKHYLQVTDDHFAKATGISAEGIVSGEENEGGAKCGAVDAQLAAQKPAQHSVAERRTRAQDTKKARKNRAEVRSDAPARDTVQPIRVPRRGVEPLSAP